MQKNDKCIDKQLLSCNQCSLHCSFCTM